MSLWSQKHHLALLQRLKAGPFFVLEDDIYADDPQHCKTLSVIWYEA